MSYPKAVTVGSLLQFLTEELAKGNVDAQTRVFVEVYSLNSEEERLKDRQSHMTEAEKKAEELDYHIPDDLPDDVVNFRVGVWQGLPDGQCRDSKGNQNTVALSIYVQKQTKPLRGGREHKRCDGCGEKLSESCHQYCGPVSE